MSYEPWEIRSTFSNENVSNINKFEKEGKIKNLLFLFFYFF